VRPLALVACAVTIAAVPSPHALPAQGSEVPVPYREAVALLEFIKHPSPPKGAFKPLEAPRWDVARLMSFIAEIRLILTDVNEPDRKERAFSHRDVQVSLTRRSGTPFKTFAHLARIYSNPYPQYSALSFTPAGEGVIVNVADWYRLTFVREKGALRLSRVDYLNEDAD